MEEINSSFGPQAIRFHSISFRSQMLLGGRREGIGIERLDAGHSGLQKSHPTFHFNFSNIVGRNVVGFHPCLLALNQTWSNIEVRLSLLGEKLTHSQTFLVLR